MTWQKNFHCHNCDMLNLKIRGLEKEVHDLRAAREHKYKPLTVEELFDMLIETAIDEGCKVTVPLKEVAAHLLPLLRERNKL